MLTVGRVAALMALFAAGACAARPKAQAEPQPKPTPTLALAEAAPTEPVAPAEPVAAEVAAPEPSGETPPTPTAEVATDEPTAQVAATPSSVPPGASATSRDPRKSSSMPRPRALLVPELQALESLLAATARNAPDRPLLLHRLAEGYVELEHAAKAEPNGQKVVAAARKKAIEHYLAVRSQYPNYPRLEQVLYYAGYERERAGELAAARALYRELAQRFPASTYLARVPRAHLPKKP